MEPSCLLQPSCTFLSVAKLPVSAISLENSACPRSFTRRRCLSLKGRSHVGFHVHASSSEQVEKVEQKRDGVMRRQMLIGTAGVLSLVGQQGRPAIAGEVPVGDYLPSAGEGNFLVFTPSANKTPALRAGNVPMYTFWLTPNFKELRIANIASGNYCQPKCAEPWTEVKFEDPSLGTVAVFASPLVRLTNKPDLPIEAVGSPDSIIAALGPFVTGDSYDPEEVLETSVRTGGGQTYYNYTLSTPYAKSGAHNLACVSAKGNAVMLLVASANERQWANSEKILRKIAESFALQ